MLGWLEVNGSIFHVDDIFTSAFISRKSISIKACTPPVIMVLVNGIEKLTSPKYETILGFIHTCLSVHKDTVLSITINTNTSKPFHSSHTQNFSHFQCILHLLPCHIPTYHLSLRLKLIIFAFLTFRILSTLHFNLTAVRMATSVRFDDLLYVDEVPL